MMFRPGNDWENSWLFGMFWGVILIASTCFVLEKAQQKAFEITSDSSLRCFRAKIMRTYQVSGWSLDPGPRTRPQGIFWAIAGRAMPGVGGLSAGVSEGQRSFL